MIHKRWRALAACTVALLLIQFAIVRLNVSGTGRPLIQKDAFRLPPKEVSVRRSLLDSVLGRKLCIFVYDALPSEVSGGGAVGAPSFRGGCRGSLYGAEAQFSDAILYGDVPDDIEIVWQSQPDTYNADIQEFDLYYLPVMVTCLSLANGLVNHTRGIQAVENSIASARTSLPFWDRSFGADHFIFMSHDVGRGLLAPGLTNNMMALVHTTEVIDRHWVHTARDNDPAMMNGWSFDGVPCGQKSTGDEAPLSDTDKVKCGEMHMDHEDPFVLRRDISVPTTIADELRAMLPKHILAIPLKQRKTNLIYFRGTAKAEYLPYSYGLRQKVMQLYANDTDFFLRDHGTDRETYLDELLNSTFCLSMPGNAFWSPRLYDFIHTGCIPIILTDATTLPFAPLLDWSRFSVRVLSRNVGRLKQIVSAIPDARIVVMQRELDRVRNHFLYNYPMKYGDATHMALQMLKLRVADSSVLVGDLQREW